jgi:hypothetical protein
MWDPRRLTTSTACYGNSFTLFYFLNSARVILITVHRNEPDMQCYLNNSNKNFLSRIWGSHSNSYRSCHVLTHSVLYSVCEPTFRCTLVCFSTDFRPRRWRWSFPPKRRFTYALYPRRWQHWKTFLMWDKRLRTHCFWTIAIGPQQSMLHFPP